MPLVGFISPTDPRWLSTLDAIKSELVTDSLVDGYPPAAAPDGLDGDDGTFSICSFSPTPTALASTPSRSATAASSSATSPQAFTHLALISAAITLNSHPG